MAWFEIDELQWCILICENFKDTNPKINMTCMCTFEKKVEERIKKGLADGKTTFLIWSQTGGD